MVVPHEAVSRSNILGLDTKGVAMVCVSYLEIKGNPAHLRYLLRRLRQKVGDAPILVGLWPAEEPVMTDESLRAHMRAAALDRARPHAAEDIAERLNALLVPR